MTWAAIEAGWSWERIMATTGGAGGAEMTVLMRLEDHEPFAYLR